MRRNPLARALRLDKMTLAALDWTLATMLDGRAEQDLPVLAQLLLPLEAHETRTRGFAKRIGDLGGSLPGSIEVRRDRVPVGGGSLPGFELDTWVLAIEAPAGADSLAAELRAGPTPVLSRVRDGVVLLDLRTVFDAELGDVEATLSAALR